jgi:hypothetical protein
MLRRWAGWLHEGGVRGKHVSFEQAGASQVRSVDSKWASNTQLGAHSLQHCACATCLCIQEDVIVRYGDDADFDGPVMEFLMRQDEVISALVRGQPITKQQFRASNPDLADEL